MDRISRIKELVEQLNKANQDYYEKAKPSMTDREYDTLYNELLELEKETGVILGNSPSQHVGYSVSSQWDKVTHEFPALSLDKTKDRDELLNWLGNQLGVLSWKCDGLTVIMTFDNGKLTSLASRGSGIEGELITANAPFINGIPKEIPYKGHLVVRGEAMISYKSFEEINSRITNEEDKFKTPRNLASGTIRNLDSKIVAARNVDVKAFELVYCDYEDMPITIMEAFEWLSNLGFDVVDHKLVDKSILKPMIRKFEDDIKNNPYPSDGLVLTYNNIAYGRSLGETSKFPRHSMAFKWNDDTYETVLKDIDWTMGKTGVLTPTAVFEPVEIDGTTVERASLHNISIMKDLELSYGDTITVYKANMIIPQIEDNLDRSLTDICIPPSKCHVCNGQTKIVKENDTEVLVCTNQDCSGKLLNKLKHFVSKDAMNINGLSEATLEKFISIGWINTFADIYKLHHHKEQMMHLDGFGKKSVEKLLQSIEDSKTTDLAHFLNALSIPNCGKSTSKDIANYCNGDINKFIDIMCNKHAWKFKDINGIGDTVVDSLNKWWFDNGGFEVVADLTDNYINVIKPESKTTEQHCEAHLNGKSYVITGSLKHFENREQLAELIISLGGKISSSVSAKTAALINNDVNSTSSKNKKARELNISIWSEEQFLDSIGYEY